MKNLFVKYEEAKVLKELGFEDKCMGWYSSDGSFYSGETTIHQGLLLAPLYTQAFKWLRHLCGIHATVLRYPDTTSNSLFFFNVEKYDSTGKFENELFSCCNRNTYARYNTYEEAELACLK